jgi:prepilin-type N-terminal cleavage/methylation domain-containing protein
MKPRRSRRRQAGFSLLELIVAAFMFAIVMAAVATAFSGAHRLRRTTERDLVEVHSIRRALGFMKRDFRSATLPSTNDVNQVTTGDTYATETNQFTFSGVMATTTTTSGGALGSTALEFYTASGLRLADQPWADVQWVTYYLRPPLAVSDAMGNELVRGVTRNLAPGMNADYAEAVLLSGVDQLIFEFWTGVEWVDYWDSTTFDPASPRAVRATLIMAATNNVPPPVYTVTAPISVEARTNVIRSANGGAA